MHPNQAKEQKTKRDIAKDEFDELLKELLVKKAEVLKRLSKK